MADPENGVETHVPFRQSESDTAAHWWCLSNVWTSNFPCHRSVVLKSLLWAL